MTQIARLYGGSMYDLAAEEKITDTVMEQMQTIRQLFGENPDYVRLLSEPSIPEGGADKSSLKLHLVRRQNGIL